MCSGSKFPLPLSPLMSYQLLLLLLRMLLDHLRGHLVRRFIISLEMPPVERATVRHRLDRRRIAVQLGLRHHGANERRAVGRLRAENVAAA